MFLLLVWAAEVSLCTFEWSWTGGADDVIKGEIQTMSIVMAAHNEHAYMKRTLDSIYEQTPASILKEIIVVDDGSKPPLKESMLEYPQVIIIRHETRQGLIRSKMEGGNKATSDMIMFLDAHVKPEPRWAPPLLRHMNENYKRVVVPVIPILDGKTWVTNYNAYGIKMMFDWSLNFKWFDDFNDLVPCMSGGLFGITRKWWHESGEYDYEMRMWGAENIEQSIRVWLCGGEIYVARDSMVAHVFRGSFPYEINNTEIYMNKVRTVEAWFDEYKDQYYAADPAARRFIPLIGSLAQRLELKEHLHCSPFSAYINRFESVFRQKDMLPSEVFLIRDTVEDLCVQMDSEMRYLEEAPCDRKDPFQLWTVGTQRITLRSPKTNKCIHTPASVSSLSEEVDAEALVRECNWAHGERQLWELSHGEVMWEKSCLQGSKVGKLRMARCLSSGGGFLEKAGRFEKFEVEQATIR